MAINFQNLFFRLSIKQKMLFARNLEVMTRSGMQILESLEILKKQTKSKAFTAMLDQLIVDVRNGHFLSAGLSHYRQVFGDFFINLIRVGETSGTLSENLKYLAEELGKKDELNKKIRGAMAYPIIILIATLGITAILAFVIFPKILPVIKSLNVPLPLPTIIFIVVSEFMIKYGLIVFISLIVLIVTLFILLRIPKFKFLWHKFLIKIPITGGISQTVNMINFSRTLGILLKSGVIIVDALEITANTINNLVYRQEIQKIAAGVRRGEPLSKFLTSDSRLFTAIFSQMVTVGENTGKLDESMLFLSNFYESEMDESTKTMSNILEPALILVMGVVVGFVALAIITPIYKITQTLGR